MPKRVLAGMRPTNLLHIGNLYGAAKGMVALQEDPNYETLYMVVDLHATTTPFDPKALRETTRNVILDYLAIGLDPDKSAIFVQSDLADLHAQLAFYLSSTVTVARMQHLPTFKEKVKQHPDNVTMALLNYPVLMAADILIYKAEKVPVGLDQEPHIEVAREIARKMNTEYGLDFPEPERFTIEGGEYIPSLTGEGKMSKSVEGSYIALTDDLETIKKRLAGAPTDSGKGDKVPASGGVANLLKLVELFQGAQMRKSYESQYTSSGLRYSELKDSLAVAIFDELKPIQARRKDLVDRPEYVDKVLVEGAAKARKVAEATVAEVRKTMGLA